MTKNLKEQAEKYFFNHISAYNNLTEKQQKQFERKKNHILRVVANATDLCKLLEVDKEDKKIAYATALFHDLGRFEQYVGSDKAKKLEHGVVAVQLLQSDKVLPKLNFDEQEQMIIYKAIENHGKLKIAKGLEERALFHAKLIRDADKLDIFQVVTQNYNSKKSEKLSWNLPKGGKISDNVKKAILQGQLVDKNDVQNETDAKILQLSWLYDINFRPTYKIIANNQYIETIYKSLSKNDDVIEIYRKVKVYVENKIYTDK